MHSFCELKAGRQTIYRRSDASPRVMHVSREMNSQESRRGGCGYGQQEGGCLTEISDEQRRISGDFVYNQKVGTWSKKLVVLPHL